MQEFCIASRALHHTYMYLLIINVFRDPICMIVITSASDCLWQNRVRISGQIHPIQINTSVNQLLFSHIDMRVNCFVSPYKRLSNDRNLPTLVECIFGLTTLCCDFPVISCLHLFAIPVLFTLLISIKLFIMKLCIYVSSILTLYSNLAKSKANFNCAAVCFLLRFGFNLSIMLW